MKQKLIALIFTGLCCLPALPGSAQAGKKPVRETRNLNFNAKGQQVTRFDKVGDALDAHDGEIALFNGVYYLYGTSYDCGFEWGNKGAPFCGFKAYSSTDMKNWTDRGFLFDAKTVVWQSRCDGKTYGCFRPHVIYNAKTKLYVLWINVYDNVVGYRVFTSKNPAGPFTEVAEPKLAVNMDKPAAGLNNGDHDTFVDDDGTAYLAYTDWRTKGSIVIEKLSADYLSGTGEHVKAVTGGNTEAPGLFKRKGLYYVVYSDPNCGYCAGTGASYKTAKSPLGPWSAGIKISDNSCGGQPSFVSTIKLDKETVYLFGSDLWNNAAKNEALANFYWAPLEFNADGSIRPMKCMEEVLVGKPVASGKSGGSGPAERAYGFRIQGDIARDTLRAQSFVAGRSAALKTLRFTSFKTGNPDAGLRVSLYAADAGSRPVGKALYTITLAAEQVSWSPRNQVVHPQIPLKKGQRYIFVLGSAATKGRYGFAYTDEANDPNTAALSADGGKTFSPEKGRMLKFALDYQQ